MSATSIMIVLILYRVELSEFTQKLGATNQRPTSNYSAGHADIQSDSGGCCTNDLQIEQVATI